VLLAGAALTAGIAATRSVRVKPPNPIDPPAVPAWLLAGALLAANAIVVIALAPVASRLTIGIALLIPWIASLIWLATRKYIEGHASRESRRSNRANDLNVTLLFTTLLILVAIHVLREPVVIGRGLVMLAPFVALLMARGVFALRNGRARAAAMAVLLFLSAASTVESYTRVNSPRDYQGLAEQIRSQMRTDDVVVVENGWWATPVHYYFPPDQFHVILASSLTGPLPERVWIVQFRQNAAEQTRRLAAERLPRYVERAHADARQAHAALFEPSAP
jgi:hypothetical protein